MPAALSQWKYIFTFNMQKTSSCLCLSVPIPSYFIFHSLFIFSIINYLHAICHTESWQADSRWRDRRMKEAAFVSEKKNLNGIGISEVMLRHEEKVFRSHISFNISLNSYTSCFSYYILSFSYFFVHDFLWKWWMNLAVWVLSLALNSKDFSR